MSGVGKQAVGERPIEELVAGNAFRDTLVSKADSGFDSAPLWHGWAIMEAFLAGIDYNKLFRAFLIARVDSLKKTLDAQRTPASFKLGDPVVVHPSAPYAVDWRDAKLFIAQITMEKTGEVSYATSDEWPPEVLTDGWKEEYLAFDPTRDSPCKS